MFGNYNRSLDGPSARSPIPGSRVSVILPIFNEAENIPLLLNWLFEILPTVGRPFEVITVNDGSRDGSLAVLRKEVEARPELRVLDFRRNYGQTAALMAGIDHATGDVIVLMDSDLQNNPHDIPVLLVKLDEGYDVVSGWRKERVDAPLSRNFVSRVANRIISKISGVPLHDYGCTLKAYRADVIKGVRLYGEMHRFIPIFASWMGAKVVEIPVQHHRRKHGRSNYGLNRIFKVILDLIVVVFLDRYFVKPIYVFGGFGLISLVAGGISFVCMIWLRLFADVSIILTPLPLMTVFATLTGILSILLGLVAEMLVRVYFESQQRPQYLVRERINFDKPA